MKFLTHTIFLFILPIYLSAQTTVSLKSDIQDSSDIDSCNNADEYIRLELVCDSLFESEDYEQYVKYYERLLELSDDNPNFKYKALYTLYYTYSERLHQYSVAKEYLSQWERFTALQDDLLDDSWETYFERRESASCFFIEIGDAASALAAEIVTKKQMEERLGTESFLYALSLNNLANAYSGLGEYEKAVDFGEQSLDLRLRLFGEGLVDSMSIARAAYNLSYNYENIDSLSGSFEYVNMALIFAAPTSDVKLNSYVRLAHLYRRIGNVDATYDALENALQILEVYRKERYIEDYWKEEYVVLREFAYLHRRLGLFKKALSYYMRIRNILSQLEVSSLDMAYFIDWEMDCYYRMGKHKQMEQLLSERYELTRDAIREAFIQLPSSQRINFMSQLESRLDLIVDFCGHIKSKQTNCVLYNIALLRKGLLLQSEIEFANYIIETGNPNLISIYEDCVQYQKKLQHGNIREAADSLSSRLENKLYELSRLVNESGDYTKMLFVTWEEVRNSLQENEVAIEFIKTHHIKSKKDEDNYCAVVLKKNFKRPHYITLTAREPIDEIEEDELYSSTKLYDWIWEPLRKELKGVSKIYFSPDAKLHQIAIEYAICPDGKRMNEHYQIYRLSSTKELTRKETVHNTYNAKLYGGLVYSADKDDLISENSKYGQERICNRSVFSPSDSAYRAGVKYLQGTKIEAEAIRQSLLQRDQKCTLYEGLSGTEESFYALEDENFDILHLATHGFYWTGDDKKKYQNLKFLSIENDDDYEDTSLLRSGLFLSGANITLKGEELPENIEDGILTAQELSLMNLGNVDLAVLSACQSGLGEVTGEGVFGLQRGFKLAGVNSLLMSLWPVDDTATRMLMVEFYKHFLDGASKIESLKKAQQYVKSQPGYEDPEYWAGFILLDALN